MKNLIFCIIILNYTFIFSQCSNVTHLDNKFRMEGRGLEGYYYKDINNVLNNFEGTYKYTDGTTSFKIKLVKKLMSKRGSYNCEDMLIGGVEYIKNGVLQFNSIPLLDTFFEDGIKYKLTANTIYTGDSRGCDECGINEKWLGGYISDPNSNQSCELFIRKIIHNGQPAIKIRMRVDIVSRMYKEGDTPPPPINLPTENDMILLKQP